MSCNMMFRRLCALAMGLLMLPSLGLLRAQADSLQNSVGDNLAELLQNQEQEPQDLEESGDILLLFPDEATEQQEKCITFLADAASALNQKMIFAPASEGADILAEFPFAIFYSLTGEETELIEALRCYTGQPLVLGAAFMNAYLYGSGEDSSGENMEETGVLRYSFNDIDWFETSVQLSSSQRFSPDPDARESGLVLYRDGSMPFFCKVGEIWFSPLTDFTSPLPQAALMQELTDWQWPYSDRPTSYAQYLVLDEIYPFMPAQMLLERVQLCIDSQIPFVLSVMPVYQNAEFPAMQQFCEVLKYAQAHGGAVILHAPIVHGEIENWESFRAQITEVTLAYTQHGVYPLGLEVPKSWIWQEDYLEFMRRYRTVFVYDTEEENFQLSCRTNLLYGNYHQLIMEAIALDHTGVGYQSNYSTAVYLDSQSRLEELALRIEYMCQNSVPLKTLWDMPHSVWADNFHLEYVNQHVEINGEPRSLVYSPEGVQEDFSYQRNTLQRVTVSLQNQNHTLLIAGSAATLIFGGMIVYARILVIRYFRRRNKLPVKKRSFGRKRTE